jgi:hypothetical protein
VQLSRSAAELLRGNKIGADRVARELRRFQPHRFFKRARH